MDNLGFLQAIVYAATYVVPILGGALADRYGAVRVVVCSAIAYAIGLALNGLGFVAAAAAVARGRRARAGERRRGPRPRGSRRRRHRGLAAR